MKTQFVQLTNGGVKAYYAALKQQRKEAAEFYRDNPLILLGEVARRFNLSLAAVKKGLAEHGIEIERERQFNLPIRRLLCPDCGERERHVCGEKQRQEHLKQAQVKKRERIDPRRIHPVTGRIMERTPDYIAYIESIPRHAPEAAGSMDLSDLTPEQREIAELGIDGLMARGRRELGIE